ncbi:hypothetical protein L3Q82_025293 [Scortum barcoo]|uniref:Uncharacterized protein n=1 Tax=Scortum barcoo TaxID=214431 RepID=A0ACB8WRY1_9TELE|nr:hypothetical protein L3Q82_025293 [Scortum barcoo]
MSWCLKLIGKNSEIVRKVPTRRMWNLHVRKGLFLTSKVSDFAQRRELVILEEFKKCLPECIVVYLNEQKVPSLSEAAVFADEFDLTQKPLPKTKAGHQYLLTMMCAATRFPEVVLLRTLRAKAVVKALVKFLSTFGLLKRIQTDQGSNFMSKIFEQSYRPREDRLREQSASVPCARLESSETLKNPEGHVDFTEPAKSDIYSLILCHFSLFGDKPTQTTVLVHDVDVGDERPIKQHAYRVNPVKRAIMKQEVEYLLENGFAVPSSSPWSSTCLLVPKSDQTHRFCTDYSKVNAITKPDSFPLPHMDDCVDRVGPAKMYLLGKASYFFFFSSSSIFFKVFFYSIQYTENEMTFVSQCHVKQLHGSPLGRNSVSPVQVGETNGVMFDLLFFVIICKTFQRFLLGLITRYRPLACFGPSCLVSAPGKHLSLLSLTTSSVPVPSGFCLLVAHRLLAVRSSLSAHLDRHPASPEFPACELLITALPIHQRGLISSVSLPRSSVSRLSWISRPVHARTF